MSWGARLVRVTQFMNEGDEWAWSDIDFCLTAQRCSSSWRHYGPSDGYIIKSEVDSAFCPEVLFVRWSEVCVCVYTRSVYPQLQYSVGHADSMLITFVPLTNTVRFLLSVGSSVGTKRFWDFECQHLLPLISTLCACLRARHLTPSHLFGLFFFFVCSVVEKWKTKKKPQSLYESIEIFGRAFHGPSGVCAK